MASVFLEKSIVIVIQRYILSLFNTEETKTFNIAIYCMKRITQPMGLG